MSKRLLGKRSRSFVYAALLLFARKTAEQAFRHWAELASAATKVQAGFRGHRDRKKIAETKRAEAGEESAPEQGQDGVDGTAESA